MYKLVAPRKWVVLDVRGNSFETVCADVESRRVKYCPLVVWNKIVLGEVSDEVYEALKAGYGSLLSEKLFDLSGKDVLQKIDFRYSFDERFSDGNNTPKTNSYNVKDAVVTGAVGLTSGEDMCNHKSLDVLVDSYGSFEGTFEELFNLALESAVEHICTKQYAQVMKK